MKSSIYFGCIVFLSLIIGCNPIKVYLEKNEVASVREYKTFLVMNEYRDKEAFNSPVLEENLQHSLVEGMKKRGFEPNDSQPDLILRYNTILTDGEKEINNMANNPWGWGMYNPWMWRNPYYMRGGGYRIEKYNLGELVIDFIDTEKDQVILRISAVGEVNKPDQKGKNLKASVDKILNEFSKRITS